MNLGKPLYVTLLLLPLATSAAPILSEDFDGPPEISSAWAYENGDSGNSLDGMISSSNGVWRGPSMELEAFQYYRLSFDAKAGGKCYWLVNYYTGDGSEHPVDHYNCFEASEEMAPREYYFHCIQGVTNARLAFRPISGIAVIDNVIIEKSTKAEAAEWADRVYAAMPPLDYTAPGDRWEHLMNTMKALKKGKTLRVVMLGDSIVNDTANSAFDARIERLYPKTRLNIIHSIRGSTGCAAYKEGRVQEMVLNEKADLLIIGGISNGDAESVRTVIRQVREKLPELEILVMSGPIGRVDPFLHPEWKSLPEEGEYRALLARVASEENCEFIDMETIWGNYVKTSGKTWEYFTRDELHGNSEGRQVLSKILETYFAPKVP